MLKKTLFLLGLFISSSLALALADTVDYELTISRIGIDNGEKAYIRPAEQLSHNCAHGVIFFDLTTASGKGYLTAITAAKMSGQKIQIASYDVNASNQCWLKSLEI